MFEVFIAFFLNSKNNLLKIKKLNILVGKTDRGFVQSGNCRSGKSLDTGKITPLKDQKNAPLNIL